MGKIIEEYIEAKLHQACVTRTIEKLWDIAQKYEKLEADYNKRLRTEMMVMLTEIQLEIEENTVRWYVGRVDGKSDDVVLIDTLNEIIEQKINALKEN